MNLTRKYSDFLLPNVIIDELKTLKINTQKILDSDLRITMLNQVLEKFINLCLNDMQDKRPLIKTFTPYLRYSDIKFFSIKLISKSIQTKKNSNYSIPFQYSDNVCYFLLSINLPLLNTDKGKKELKKMKNFILNDSIKFQTKSAFKYYSNVWIALLKFKISLDCYKKILSSMNRKIIPFLKNPLDLADFLINSYKIGGSIALLSLSPLFSLITKYNLEYPDFYSNFYSLIKPEILYVKYASIFLYWANIFLSSINLPSYMIAAFIKKFSRLALISPLEILYALLPLIENLLIRHPNLIEMFNKSKPCEYETDPFNFEEENLKLTKATESSLWEIKLLQKHWNKKIRNISKFINFDLPKDEIDLRDNLKKYFFDFNYEEFNKPIPEVDIDLNQELGKTAFDFFQGEIMNY